MAGCLDLQTEIEGSLVTMAFIFVCECVCILHTCCQSVWRRLNGKVRGEEKARREREEMQRQTTHSCGTRFRFPVSLQENNTVRGLLQESGGILSCFFCVFAYKTTAHVAAAHHEEKPLQTASLKLQLSRTALTLNHSLKPPSHLSS